MPFSYPDDAWRRTCPHLSRAADLRFLQLNVVAPFRELRPTVDLCFINSKMARILAARIFSISGSFTRFPRDQQRSPARRTETLVKPGVDQAILGLAVFGDGIFVFI